ncbi:MAG: type III glutamate--ammonia ligase [Candidatus Andersenbacteria bacterium]|nr:type III glutamate--ammonia ligase [Candidatus Andersenbacteria bacterium]
MGDPLTDLKNQMNHDGVKQFFNQFVDIHGMPKSKMVPFTAIDESFTEGNGFAGATCWGMGQGPQDPDLMARIDPQTYKLFPWLEAPDGSKIGRLIGDLYVEEKEWPNCSRYNLKRILDWAKEQFNFVFNVGVEPEHMLGIRDKETGKFTQYNPNTMDCLDKPGYDHGSMVLNLNYLCDLRHNLEQLHFTPYQFDHEDGNGQFEANFLYRDALRTADQLILFRILTRDLARKHCQMEVTFQAKPVDDLTGNGLHTHFHVASAKTGDNLFTDLKDPRGLGLSKLAYHFIGGIFHHARALCAITNPTVNCYKRINVEKVEGSLSGINWVPGRIAYGGNNRTLMIRTPGPGHCEDRSPSGAANPYLYLAAYLMCGIDGIEKKMDPGEPFRASAYRNKADAKILPQSLREAWEELNSDKVVLDALGPISHDFIEIKEKEAKASLDKRIPEQDYTLVL